MLLNPFTFHSPKSPSEAIELYSSLENVKMQAGGTFLFNNLKLLKKKGVKTPAHVISLKKIADLKGICKDKDAIIIKAMTTMSELLDSPLLTDNTAILKIAAKNIGTSQIRNMATVGGNLTCRYTWTEMPAIMIGLNADLHFMGPDGGDEIICAEDFFKASAKTSKLFTHASIKKDPKALVTYHRVKKSPHIDIPLLSLLIKTNSDGKKFKNTRVAINNCAAFSQRDHKLEDFINQSTSSKNLAQEALAHLDEPIYNTRSSDYKKHMFRVAIKDAIEQITGEK
jgi:CO/xanthine dehydrogenase FAD-binding subunit